MTPTLKPCPFCGGKARITEVKLLPEAEIMAVGCIRCQAEIKSARQPVQVQRLNICGEWEYISTGLYMEDNAVERWNRRDYHENP